jgi:hypothetical protein
MDGVACPSWVIRDRGGSAVRPAMSALPPKAEQSPGPRLAGRTQLQVCNSLFGVDFEFPFGVRIVTTANLNHRRLERLIAEDLAHVPDLLICQLPLCLDRYGFFALVSLRICSEVPARIIPFSVEHDRRARVRIKRGERE